MTRLTYLDISGGYIYYLKCGNISYLPSLKKLDLQRSQIYDICDQAFKELRRLTELHLGHNILSQLPTGVFSSLYSLRNLLLNNNYFKSFDEEVCNGSYNLISLNLTMNHITNFNFEALRKNSCKSIETISIRRNVVETIDITYLPELVLLKTLDAEENHIVIIYSDHNNNITDLAGVQNLNLLKNPLLNFANTAKNILAPVKSLKISMRNAMEISALRNLERLTIDPCYISSNLTFSHHPKLKNLIVRNVKNPPFMVKKGKFERLMRLNYLYDCCRELNRNGITKIQNDSFPFLPSLKSL
ncbi:Leucine-rich repeats and immunoglobulin-like domains protein 1 [Trichoplax sp. H2]|nr:Leucine-rich repeats and immunoglobulin-like domains protein 1 [Trichoplax sp. H2]|eukprot:RDD40605.1 Leucine-rich repeats and immunoglobulin-like domains protein 1 [Trichoplax sp. H2]